MIFSEAELIKREFYELCGEISVAELIMNERLAVLIKEIVKLIANVA